MSPPKTPQDISNFVRGTFARPGGSVSQDEAYWTEVKNPYNYLLKEMPEGYDPGDWRRFVDLLNADYRRSTPSGRQKLLKRSINELIAYGNTKNAFPTPGRKKKQDAVSQIKEAAGKLGADATTRQENIDAEIKAANEGDAAALAGLKQTYDGLNKQDQNALADYLAKTDPMMAEIVARPSDPADLQRQIDAYAEQKSVADKYKALTDPQVTAQERFMAEKFRREFEAADRSNRAAVSEQMANRGLRSGGQEIAANQSMQQQLAQDRLLNELGISANAVDRSMTAMEGWNTAAGNLGTQSAAIRTANDSQRQFEDEFRQNEAERRGTLASQRHGAQTTTTKNIGEREGDLYDAGATNRAVRTTRAYQGATTGATANKDTYDALVESLKLDMDLDADEREEKLNNPL